MARSMFPGRSLDPSSNAGARGMITLLGFPGETELGLETRFRSSLSSTNQVIAPGELVAGKKLYQILLRRYKATVKLLR